MKLCSKAFSQQSIKSMVSPIKSNAYVVEFDGSGQPSLLLPSSQDYWCSFLCVSIEHMILYQSVLAFLINSSKTFPCNFSQMYVLYQGPPVIHSELYMSISYFNFSCVSIIHNILTWCKIVFNTKVVIIYWYVVSKISTSTIVSFSQLPHLTEIFTPVFFISSSLGLYHNLTLNIENSFNNDGKRFYHYLSYLK